MDKLIKNAKGASYGKLFSSTAEIPQSPSTLGYSATDGSWKIFKIDISLL